LEVCAGCPYIWLKNVDQTLQAIKLAIYETSVTWEVSKIFSEIRRLLYNLC
jgi:hypothetical protein